MTAPDYTIRLAMIEDIPGIVAIYNEAIETTTATFDVEPMSLTEGESWFHGHTWKWPIIVAANEDCVLGWASLSRWSERAAYDGTAELSFYICSAYRGRGIGRRLAEEIIQRGKEASLHTLLAIVADESEASLHILKSLGFEQAGQLREVGYKFGRLLDVQFLQLIY